MAARSRFLDPPRLRTIEEGFEERHATWLELFFDLVFVVAIAELGLNLTRDPTAHGFVQYVALFVPVWWAWAGFTFYANRFDTDDLAYRLLVLVGMFAVAALATYTPEALDRGGRGFAGAYVCVRLVVLVLYARAYRFVPQARPLAGLFFMAFSVAVVIWLCSLLVEPPGRWWLWMLAVAVELSAPLFAWRRLPGTSVDPRHLPERFGLLTIIVLGESVVAVVLGVADASWDVDSGFAALGGFFAAAAVWWIYFEFLDDSAVRRGRIAGFVFTYAHFPVAVGIAALGVGVKFDILSAAGTERFEGTTWVFCAGVAICMVGLAAIHAATPPVVFDPDVWMRLATAVVALVLLGLSFSLPPLAVVWALTAVLVAQVVVEIARHEGHAGGGPEL